MIGIGGIGMSGIAELLLNQGFQVSGSDARESEITRQLSGIGATISVGHSAASLAQPDVVVISSAIPESNPELEKARESGIPVIRRAEMLAELMRLKTGIAVAGSHGKTSTTSLMASVLSEAGLDPTYVIGGRLKSTASGARLGSGEFLLAEADESDGSFLLLSPIYVVVTNIDREHMDHYGEMDRLQEAFLNFINRIPFFGRAILNADDVYLSRLLPDIVRPKTTYGLTGRADYRAENIRVDGMRMRFDLLRHGQPGGEYHVGLPGRHYVANSLAVIALADELGLDAEAVRRGLAHFTGVGRRFEVHRRDEALTVVDDYGHHPTEIRATLAAARGMHGGRLVAVFQPHRYSRTYDLLKEFQAAFDTCDLLILLDIYPAGEKETQGINSLLLSDAIRSQGTCEVIYLTDSRPLRDPGVFQRTLDRVGQSLKAGDLVLTFGAGDITTLAPALAGINPGRSS